jgi:DNA polymerase I-like protein with 3'-5' exonuclease and polymerase domains
MKDKREIPIQNIPLHTDLGKKIRDAFVRKPITTDLNFNDLERRIASQMGIDPDKQPRERF